MHKRSRARKNISNSYMVILFSHLSREDCLLALGSKKLLFYDNKFFYLVSARHMYAYNSTYNLHPESLASTHYGRLCVATVPSAFINHLMINVYILKKLK